MVFSFNKQAGVFKENVRMILDCEAASVMCQYEISEIRGQNVLRDEDCLAVNWNSKFFYLLNVNTAPI